MHNDVVMSSRPSDQQWHLTELCEDTVNICNAYRRISFSKIYPQQQMKARSETQQLNDGVHKSNSIATQKKNVHLHFLVIRMGSRDTFMLWRLGSITFKIFEAMISSSVNCDHVAANHSAECVPNSWMLAEMWLKSCLVETRPTILVAMALDRQNYSTCELAMSWYSILQLLSCHIELHQALWQSTGHFVSSTVKVPMMVWLIG